MKQGFMFVFFFAIHQAVVGSDADQSRAVGRAGHVELADGEIDYDLLAALITQHKLKTEPRDTENELGRRISGIQHRIASITQDMKITGDGMPTPLSIKQSFSSLCADAEDLKRHFPAEMSGPGPLVNGEPIIEQPETQVNGKPIIYQPDNQDVNYFEIAIRRPLVELAHFLRSQGLNRTYVSQTSIPGPLGRAFIRASSFESDCSSYDSKASSASTLIHSAYGPIRTPSALRMIPCKDMSDLRLDDKQEGATVIPVAPNVPPIDLTGLSSFVPVISVFDQYGDQDQDSDNDDETNLYRAPKNTPRRVASVDE